MEVEDLTVVGFMRKPLSVNKKEGEFIEDVRPTSSFQNSSLRELLVGCIHFKGAKELHVRIDVIDHDGEFYEIDSTNESKEVNEGEQKLKSLYPNQEGHSTSVSGSSLTASNAADQNSATTEAASSTVESENKIRNESRISCVIENIESF